jgi:hypothetical protein
MLRRITIRVTVTVTVTVSTGVAHGVFGVGAGNYVNPCKSGVGP